MGARQRGRTPGKRRLYALSHSIFRTRAEVWFIVITYVSASGLWILFSDRLVEALIENADTRILVSIIKGWLFVFVTGILLYVLVSRLVGRMKQARDTWERTFDAVPDLVMIMDENHRVVHMNRAMASRLGCSPEACYGRACHEVVHQSGETPWICPRRDLAEDGEQHTVEIREDRLGGVFLVSVTPIVDPVAGRVGILHIARDVTAQKAAEHALAKSEEKFSKTFHRSPVAITISSVRTRRFVDVNKAFELASGYARDEVIGRTARELGLWASPMELELANQTVEQLGGYQNLAMRFYRKDGETREAVVSAELIDLAGESCIMSVAMDVTEHRHTEEEANRLVTAVEQAAEAVLIADVDACILYVNPAFTLITGYEREEILGGNPRILQSGRHDAAFYERLWRTLLSGDVWTGRFINRRKDGTLYEAECTISPVRDTAGLVINYVSIARDVSRELELERQLRQSQKMEAVGTLAGGIAHDFNNILQSILGYVDLARDDVTEGGLAEGCLGEILSASERARSLIQRLLAFSRQNEQEHRPLRLQRIIREALRLLRGSLPSTIEIQSELDDKVGFVMADPTLIHQIVMNLCTNAYHAMRETGGTLTLRLDEVRGDSEMGDAHPAPGAGAYARLIVSDSGCGMDEATAKRVFDPYFTTKKIGEGTGLGLSVVHGIVKDLSGAILLTSEPGVGTTFTVLLPICAAPAIEPVGHSREAEQSLAGTERVLLVDDEVSIGNSMSRALRRYGYQTEVCSSSLDALDLFRAEPGHFDVVVTDRTMPGMDGIQFAASLREVRADIRVVLCTGYSDLADHPKTEAASIDAFLAKPFMPEALARTIRSVLDGTAMPESQ